MKYRIGTGITLALVLSLLIGLTAVLAGDEQVNTTVAAGAFSGNPALFQKAKPTTGEVVSASETPSTAKIPAFFVLSVGLMMVTTTAIVTSKELFPNPPSV